VKPAFQLLAERVEQYTPEWAAGITGIPVETIKRLAHEMGVTARDQKIELPIAWTDVWDNEHRRSPAIRSPSTPCAAWRRIPTVSIRSARWAF
jgi:anaerobic selenocysteine-containing dehydrogenase